MFDIYSFESDNDEINIDFGVTTNDETAVDDAGEDSKTTDVSNISSEKTDHNEEASAGGVATGSNEDDIAVDPVAATESFIWKEFGISAEDVDRTVADVVQEAEQIPDESKLANDDYDEYGMIKDPDLEAVGVYNAGAVVDADDTTVANDPLPENQPVNMDDGENDNDAPNTVVVGDSTESLSRSMEKAFGYFKNSDFINPDYKKDKNVRKYIYGEFSTPKEFLNSKIGKSKIDGLKADLKSKGMTPATMKECNTLKSTFFHKYLRGNDQTLGPLFKYYTVDGIVFATWGSKGLGEFSCVALVKTSKGKITSVGYAINVPVRKGVTESEESFVDYCLSREGFKVSGMPNVKSVDEYFKLNNVKSCIDTLKNMMDKKDLDSLKASQLGENKKKLLSQSLPSSSKIAKMKEMGIDFTISDKSSNGVNFIILRCKIDNSDVASVFVALKKKDSNKYSLKLFGDMNLASPKSEESLLFNMFM